MSGHSAGHAGLPEGAAPAPNECVLQGLGAFEKGKGSWTARVHEEPKAK